MSVAVPDDKSDYVAESSPTSHQRLLLGALVVVALAGALFSGQSTWDFMQHLDRQVHGIHCSFIPGAAAEIGESGCRAVMLSPYSSFFRASTWGGIPVSLWALAVFAYLLFKSGQLAVRQSFTRREGIFLAAAWALPALMSLIYGWLALSKVEATCKVCVGMYVTSALGLALSIAAVVRAPPDPEHRPAAALWAGWFAQGCAYVAIATLAYLGFAPDAVAAAGKSCGSLVQEGDPNGVLLPLATVKGGTPAIEVLDPLCPSCRAFDQRLAASGFGPRLDLKAVLFPLDSTCNWMVDEPLHPGACAVSEALLCVGPLSKSDAAGQQKAVNELLGWAFEHQEDLRAQAKTDEKAMRASIEAKFPAVKGCLGSAQARNRLVKSLRWGVANAIPVLTPQLFIGKQRVCDEDTDLGLDYTLERLLAKGGAR